MVLACPNCNHAIELVVKSETKDDLDCSSHKCVPPTRSLPSCSDFACGDGFTPNAMACDVGGCTAQKCCDQLPSCSDFNCGDDKVQGASTLHPDGDMDGLCFSCTISHKEGFDVSVYSQSSVDEPCPRCGKLVKAVQRKVPDGDRTPATPAGRRLKLVTNSSSSPQTM